jgi:CheY-like chemotaxis protein
MWSRAVTVSKNQPKAILVVDDDSIIRDMMVDILDLEGYTVHIARNGREALDHLQSLRYVEDGKGYLIFLDLMMPIMDGRTFCLELMAQPELRTQQVIVMMSAMDQLDQTSSLNVDTMMPKPFVVDDVLSIIHQYID